MAHPRLVQLICLLLCGGLVFAAAQFVPAINAGRKTLNEFGSADVATNTPPEYAFAIQAFGAFRSLIVNIAFIRAENYKEQGRYYDAMQLASWICKLQPRFPSVWEFQSWNMAWNISVTTYTPEERWNWVYNGVRLLRDEGIRYNPRAINLYKQIAWIFNNKMGETLDDFHLAYKRNWAWRMHLVLGPPPSTLGNYRPGQTVKPVVLDVADDPLFEVSRAAAAQNDEHRRQLQAQQEMYYRTKTPLTGQISEIERAAREAETAELTPADFAKRAWLDYLQSIDAAPRTLEGLYAQEPKTREMVADLRGLGVTITDDTLDEDSYWFDGKLAGAFFARYRKLMDTPAVRLSIEQKPESAGADEEKRLARFDEIVGVRARRPEGLALVRFLQRKVLTEVYKLKLERMEYVVENFGAVDWRLTDAQGLYWVTEGLIQSGESPHKFENDKVNTARILFFCLRNLFNRNRFTFEPYPEDISRSYFSFAPDPDFVEPMHRAYITYGKLLDPDPGNESGAGDMFRAAHINFLGEAIRMLYFSGREKEAEHYYEYLRTSYTHREGGELELTYTKPLRDFVVDSMYGVVEGPRESQRVIADMLMRAYNELANEDYEAYTRYVSKALEFHQTYGQERARAPSGNEPKGLPKFQDMQIDVFRFWFTVPAFNSSYTIRKSRLWRVAPLHLKQSVYDDLAEGLKKECDAWSFNFAGAFPEPPEMEAFRKEHPSRQVDRRTPTADTPAQPAGD